MDGELVERARLCEDGVDAAGAEALEGVAALRCRIENLGQLGLDRGGVLRWEQVLDDGVAVAIESGGDIVGRGVCA